MTNLTVLPDRSPLIPSDEWSYFVQLATDIRLTEKLLRVMKNEYRKREQEIHRKLKDGASIENAGRVAILGLS